MIPASVSAPPVAPAPTAPTPAPPPPSPAPAAAKPSAAIGLVIAAVAIVAAAAGGWWWLHRQTAPQSPVAAATDSAGSAVPPVSAPAADPAQLVVDFLQRNDWSEASVSALNSAWWNLSDAQIAPLLGQDSVKQLRTALAARLAEQVHKVKTGGPRLDPSAPLVLLARNLNVSIPDEAVTSFGPAQAAATPPTPARAAVQPPTAPSDKARIPSASAPASSRPASRSASAPATVAAAAGPQAAASPTRTGTAAPTSSSTTATAPTQAATNDPCRDYFTNQRHRYCHDTLAGGVAAPALAIIPAGSYTMGGVSNPEELPAHPVVISRPFAVTIGEISADVYAQFCTQTGRSCAAQPWPGEARPVVNVSWSDANDFAAWLSRQTGQHYRLPSEAEWEYFARAGSHGDYWADAPLNPGQAIFTSASGSPQAPAAADNDSVAPNKWSLKHVAGNVREWVADGWNDNYVGAPGDGSARGGDNKYRVVRGGSYQRPLGEAALGGACQAGGRHARCSDRIPSGA